MATEQSSLTVLLGGEKMTAKFRDGHTEEVIVRQPPIRELPEFLAKYDEEQALVEFACSQTEKWGDNLTDDSLHEIYDKARELNDPRLDRWLKRRAATVQREKSLLKEFSTKTSA